MSIKKKIAILIKLANKALSFGAEVREKIELRILIKLANKTLWLGPEVREKLQRGKINVVPSNFYSEIPSVEEIRNSFEYSDSNKAVYDKIFDHQKLKGFCEELYPYSLEFAPPMDGDKDDPEGFFWKNPAYSHLDAMSYYCMIRYFKPKRILEIGSGFSTLVADMAIKANGFGEIVSIEPYPMPFLEKIDSVSEIVKEKVQEIPLEKIVGMVEDSDMWFIDSTHTVKIGSDCLYIYLKVMPEIKSKTVLHTHDIYLPFGMNQQNALNKHIYWTEQYLLYAYLVDNPKADVIFGSCYTFNFMKDIAEGMMHDRGVGCGGASLWYTLNA